LPVWLKVSLIVAAALIAGSWAEAKLNIIIAELRAIRENLDRLWSDRTEQDVDIAEEENDG
jgi:hypothetical protein